MLPVIQTTEGYFLSSHYPFLFNYSPSSPSPSLSLPNVHMTRSPSIFGGSLVSSPSSSPAFSSFSSSSFPLSPSLSISSPGKSSFRQVKKGDSTLAPPRASSSSCVVPTPIKHDKSGLIADPTSKQLSNIVIPQAQFPSHIKQQDFLNSPRREQSQSLQPQQQQQVILVHSPSSYEVGPSYHHPHPHHYSQVIVPCFSTTTPVMTTTATSTTTTLNNNTPSQQQQQHPVEIKQEPSVVVGPVECRNQRTKADSGSILAASTSSGEAEDKNRCQVIVQYRSPIPVYAPPSPTHPTTPLLAPPSPRSILGLSSSPLPSLSPVSLSPYTTYTATPLIATTPTPPTNLLTNTPSLSPSMPQTFALSPVSPISLISTPTGQLTPVLQNQSQNKLTQLPASSSSPVLASPVDLPAMKANTTKGDYRCEHPGCGKMLKTRLALARHTKSHVGKPYLCDYAHCRKPFLESNTLARHRRIHTGERPFKCTFEGCTSAFSDVSNCRRHTASHFNTQKFKCPVSTCKRSATGFTRSDTLRNHLRTCHLAMVNEGSFPEYY